MTKVAKKQLLKEKEDLKIKLRQLENDLFNLTGVDYSAFTLEEVKEHIAWAKQASTEELLSELNQLKKNNSVSKIPLQNVDFPTLDGIALPTINAIQLNNYMYKNGRYEVYLINGIQASFFTELEAIEFLNNVSIKMNECYRFLNWAYTKAFTEIQPHYPGLDAPTRRHYLETITLIGQQFQLSLRTYANDNFQYFKKSEYIAEKLLKLIEIGSAIPSTNESLRDIKTVLKNVVLNLGSFDPLAKTYIL